MSNSFFKDLISLFHYNPMTVNFHLFFGYVFANNQCDRTQKREQKRTKVKKREQYKTL